MPIMGHLQMVTGVAVYKDMDDIEIWTTEPPGRDAAGNPFIGLHPNDNRVL